MSTVVGSNCPGPYTTQTVILGTTSGFAAGVVAHEGGSMIDMLGLFAVVASIGLTVLLIIVSLLSLSIAIITSEKRNEPITAQPAFAHVIGTAPGILIGLGIFVFVVVKLASLDRDVRLWLDISTLFWAGGSLALWAILVRRRRH
jgi:hypothetical protein